MARGLHSAGLIPDYSLFHAIDASLCTWQVPVFAFIAGLFVYRGMTREGPWPYAWSRIKLFIWLYVLWSLIQNLFKLLAGTLINNPISPPAVLQLWVPDGQLWFFGWIAIAMVLAAAIYPLVQTRWIAIPVVIIVAVSAAAWGLNGLYLGTQGLGLLIFFVAGLLVRGDRVIAWVQQMSLPVAVLIAVIGIAIAITGGATGIATPPKAYGELRTGLSIGLGFVTSFCGLAGIMAFSRLLEYTGLRRPLAYVGSASMAIFVAHIVFASGTRVILSQVGIDSLSLMVLGGTLMGVLGPLVLQYIAPKVKMDWLFALPTRPQRDKQMKLSVAASAD